MRTISSIFDIECILKMNDMPSEFDRIVALKDWSLTVEDEKEGVKLWQRKGENAFEGFKTQGIVNESAADVLTVLTHSRKYKGLYEKNYDMSMQVSRIAD